MQNNISCSIKECKHNGMMSSCSKDSVKIGKTTDSVDCSKCTECASFEPKI